MSVNKWNLSRDLIYDNIWILESLSYKSSQSYVMTDGQSASPWCQAPIWDPRPDFYFRLTVAGLLMWSTLSLTRTGLSFTIAVGSRQRSHSRVRIPRDSWSSHSLRFETLLTWRARFPHSYPPGTVWPSYTPRHWVLSVASYDSQDYGGGIRTRLHAESTLSFIGSTPDSYSGGSEPNSLARDRFRD
jgi:hypothetical protein